MTDVSAGGARSPFDTAAYATRVKRRNAAEKRFRVYGLVAIGLALSFLVVLFSSVIVQALGAFTQTKVQIATHVAADAVDPGNIRAGDFGGMLKKALRERFPEVSGPARNVRCTRSSRRARPSSCARRSRTIPL